MNNVNELTRIPENDITSSVSNAEATIVRAEVILKLIAKHIRPTEIRIFGENVGWRSDHQNPNRDGAYRRREERTVLHFRGVGNLYH